MSEYLAKYTLDFRYLDGTYPDETRRPTYRFEAETEEEAKKIAEEHLIKIKTQQACSLSVTLDQLLEVKDVNIE